jgi:hypothetical protein
MAAAAKVVFDRSRPYGEIFGEHQGTPARYEQGGFYFTEAGELVRELLTPEQTKLLEEAKGKVVSPKTAPKPEGVDVDDINLTAWGTGAIDYPFAAVREAVKRRYNIVGNGPSDTAEFLAMEANLFAVEDIALKHRADARGSLKAA